jgi:hypothetical protein
MALKSGCGRLPDPRELSRAGTVKEALKAYLAYLGVCRREDAPTRWIDAAHTLPHVLGYHGCEAAVAEKVFSWKANLKPSAKDYDC